MSLTDIVRYAGNRLTGYDLNKNRPEAPVPRKEFLARLSGIPELDERIYKNQIYARLRELVYVVRLPLARLTPLVCFTGTIALKTLLPESQLKGFDDGDKFLIAGLAIHALDYLIFDMITPALRRRRSLQNVRIPDSF